MRKRHWWIVLGAGFGLLGVTALTGGAIQAREFSASVTDDGTIMVPSDYRTLFAHLGTWSVADGGENGAVKQLHVVYAEADAIKTYRESGEFPDGAVIVKEVLAAEARDMTTGHVSRAAQTVGWFVMVKDSQNRFPESPLWGRGWGWAYFEAGSPDATISTDYVKDCLGCHIPAQATDWIYVDGYPVLTP